jgi:hypothetical protein
MRSINSLLKVAALAAALMAIPAIAAAQSIDVPKLYLMSSLINFTKGQAVSIDFCNVDKVTREVRLYFVDVNGNVMKTSSARVAPGRAVSLNFTYGELPRGSASRMAMRGIIAIGDPPSEADPPGEADPPTEADPPSENLSLGSIQVYEILTGKTTFGLLVPAVRNLNVYFPTDQ